MIDLKNGSIIINDQLKFYPKYSFDDFKKTKYFNGQDGIRMIYLNEKQRIAGNQYIVSLFFRNEMIYMLSLQCCNDEYSMEREQERNRMHDKILCEEDIISGKDYGWGIIISEYDARRNISSINIYYKIK